MSSLEHRPSRLESAATDGVLAVANHHCALGETPRWNERDGKLYWQDIDTGRLFRIDHETGAHECFFRGPVSGAFTLQDDGNLLLFEADRIAVLDPATGQRRVVREGIDHGMRRFNDAIADPEGRVYVGTIGRTDDSGGLYRVDRDGTITCLWKGTGCSNGMGFTADARRFYWTCSSKRTIYVSDYDRATGALTARRPFHVATAEDGIPDGLVVDADDCLWTACYGESKLLRLDPTAAVIGQVHLPVPKVTAATFAGPALDTLYITTAGGEFPAEATSAPSGTDDAHPAAGALYRAPATVRGKPGFRSRIDI